MTRRFALGKGALLLLAVLASAVRADPGDVVAAGVTRTPAPMHFADAQDVSEVHAGREVYRTRCARCHGRRLEGQALWQLNDRFAHQRAPAHDDTGHTWQHGDEELFQITRSGRLPGMPDDVKSTMPAFAGVLSDEEIVDVLAYIKSRWSLGIRVSQATLNPAFAGMPEGADRVAWTLPPNCTGSLQAWKSETAR